MAAESALADLDYVPRRRERLRCCPLDGEAVLYDPLQHVVHYLNQTAYFIWALCDGRCRVDDIAYTVAGAFEVDGEGQTSRAGVLGDVRHALVELADHGLIDLLPMDS